MKLVLMTSAFWLAAIFLGFQIIGQASDSSVLAAGPAGEATPGPAATPSPRATPGGPNAALEKMRTHMDSMMRPGSFDRMHQAMVADADTMMQACAPAMEQSGDGMKRGSMNDMMNGGMETMMGGMMNGRGNGSMGGGMMGR